MTLDTAAAIRMNLTDAAMAEVTTLLGELGDASERDFVSVFTRVARGMSLREAMGLPPQVIDLLYAQAFSRFESRRLPEATQLFQALTLLAPEVVDHWLGLGICLRTAGEEAAAGAMFDIAASLAPQNPAVIFHRADLHCQRRNWDAARQDIARFEALPETETKRKLTPEIRRLAAVLSVRG